MAESDENGTKGRATKEAAGDGPSPGTNGEANGDVNGEANGEANASAPIAAGLILAAVALGFVLAPRIVAWADGVSPGLGFPAALVMFALLGGGFVAVFWLRGRARR